MRQVTKYEHAAEADPSLVLMTDLPGSQMPPWDIDPIGVKRISASEVEALIDTGRWGKDPVELAASELSAGAPGAGRIALRARERVRIPNGLEWGLPGNATSRFR